MQENLSMKKLLLTTIALAALAASPAFAKSHHSTATTTADPADESYAAGPAAGLTSSGPAIYSNGQYAGWDPDPNIRFQLLRDPAPTGD